MLTEKLKETVIRASQKSQQRRLPAHEIERIEWMFRILAKGDRRALPSRYWEELNKMNLEQLNENGYENFKRTITLNYFTWTRLLPWDSQIRFLCRALPFHIVAGTFFRSLAAPKHDFYSSLSRAQSLAYNFLTLLQWEYIFRLPLPTHFLDLREPDEGNPPLVYPRVGMNVSQDLANSLIEFDAYRSTVSTAGPVTILELGGGYGRNAFVSLKLLPNAKHLIVDIPPGLWVAERYLSSVFPDKRIMRVRDFEKFADIAEEYGKADIVFLLSSQLEKLPPRTIDCIVNISSLHEMRREQVAYYFDLFDRVLKPAGHFYFKQWKVAKVLFEGGLTLVESDYPVPSGWNRLFSRTARVQTKFFEALYQKA